MQKLYCRGIYVVFILMLAGMTPVVHADEEMSISAPLQEPGSGSGTVTFTFELEGKPQHQVFPNVSSATHPTTAVPEPSTLVLVGVGLLGGLTLMRKRRKH